ncbi:MAG: SAM-dependent chlorinase/fluorinase [Candidatus Caldarchaeum sp.]|nr:SAM-dependent chlorinase/fluorinase [Candidatus Caldarchaeum sp.]
MKNPVVALLTDYGLRDTYVAELKAVLLKFRTDLIFVDISHDIQPFNILQGAFLLKLAAKSFPNHTIFIAVVDPTVGSKRDGIALFTKSGKIFVGPDNGLLAPAAKTEGIDRTFRIKTEGIPHVSPTFHGRDVFAYLVGHLIAGKDFQHLVETKTELTDLNIPKPTKNSDHIEAVILHVDRFGNAITNIEGPLPDDWSFAEIVVNDKHIEKVKKAKTYADVQPKEPLLVVGGTGYTEIALNQGNAAQTFGLSPGDVVKIFKNRP